jgi:hypothetical protein
MPRCRKILANGKRCKAHAIAGSKFCLFHTPNQKMKRGHQRKVTMNTAAKSKTRIRRVVENQAAVRGSRLLGGYLVAKAMSYWNEPDYRVITKQHAARRNVQGTVYLGAKTQRTIEPTLQRDSAGTGFKQTSKRARKRKVTSTMLKSGRMIPMLGYAFVGWNMYGAYKQGGVGGVATQTAHDWHAATIANDVAEASIAAWSLYRLQNQVTSASRTTMNMVGPGF